MATASDERKLSCPCSKQLARFTKEGLELYCRYSKEVTTVPYGIANLEEAIAWIERRDRQLRRGGRSPRI